MAVWGKIKITSSGKNTASIQPAPILRFSETLANALGNRKAKYKDVSKDLNKLINKEEEESPIAAKPPFDVERIKLVMQRIIRQQFNLKDEDGDPIKYVYNPAKNLELSQKIAKAIQDRVRSYNYSRYRIVSFCSVIEKENQGVSYKMKYAIDPYLDNYAQYVHDMAKFWVIATVLLVHKD
ncbi:uncharacterized protein LOC119767033 [Culex quinquefasciatus]|uniref:uncharacterized protein LOC119767033 n=1 Tax=Culex quinquefasciatus TaxID=7176 RepID=UPI0018E31E94|nr:uncharacterized protein LOC119767033 [Culex quinquefasciatus]